MMYQLEWSVNFKPGLLPVLTTAVLMYVYRLLLVSFPAANLARPDFMTASSVRTNTYVQLRSA